LGSVIEPMRNRQEKWNGQPFSAVEEVVELEEELVALVLAAAPGDGIELQMVSVAYDDKSYPLMPVGDFRELAPALDLEGGTFNLNAETAGHPKPVGVLFTLYGGSGAPWANLTVQGTNEVAVNGVFVAAKERVDALYDRMHRAQAQAAEAAQKAEEAAASDPLWKQFLDSEWTKIIVGGIVVLIIGFVLGKVF
jgi:hypothetical protein